MEHDQNNIVDITSYIHNANVKRSFEEEFNLVKNQFRRIETVLSNLDDIENMLVDKYATVISVLPSFEEQAELLTTLLQFKEEMLDNVLTYTEHTMDILDKYEKAADDFIKEKSAKYGG